MPAWPPLERVLLWHLWHHPRCVLIVSRLHWRILFMGPLQAFILASSSSCSFLVALQARSLDQQYQHRLKIVRNASFGPHSRISNLFPKSETQEEAPSNHLCCSKPSRWFWMQTQVWGSLFYSLLRLFDPGLGIQVWCIYCRKLFLKAGHKHISCLISPSRPCCCSINRWRLTTLLLSLGTIVTCL